YRPFKQKKKTRATEAKRLGLEPLANLILAGKHRDIESAAGEFLTEVATSVEMAVKGAKDIIAKIISDNTEYRLYILKIVKDPSEIVLSVKKNEEDEQCNFSMYYEYAETVKNIVPHRVLALNRGDAIKVLSVKLTHDTERITNYIKKQVIEEHAKTKELLTEAIEDSLKRL